MIWVIDFKSSKGIWDEMKTQVNVYYMVWNLYHAIDNGKRADRVGILRLDKETGLLDDPPILDCTEGLNDRWEAFLNLRKYYGLIIEPDLSEKKKERFYSLENGKKIPTVTTILDLLHKPALVQWAANSVAEYVGEHIKDMTTDEQIEYHLKKAKTAHRDVSKKAMDIGSIVHDAIHAYLSGADYDKIVDGNDKAINAMLAFLEWADKVKIKPIALEKKLIDPKNEFGGTVDFVGELN